MKLSLIASTDLNELGIHGPRVLGATPKYPVLFRVPATGCGKLHFQALKLPEDLSIDSETGIISGAIGSEGIYRVQLEVCDAFNSVSRTLNIIAGSHKLARTPPMGWNSWNIWHKHVNDQHVRQAADALVEKKLTHFGYNYVNIDDTWEGTRDSSGKITSNDKFPNMKQLGDYLHAKGLKFGIYSSPGPKTCGGYEGSYGHELDDARTFAEWGVDLLKYDWCSYGSLVKPKKWAIPHFFNDDHFYVHFVYPVDVLKGPYQKMRDCLDKVPRDIVYSLCPMTLHKKYNPAFWGSHVGGDLWRTSGDIKDNWKSMSNLGFRQHKYYHTHGPGYWNDPDMLAVGQISCDTPIHPTHLTPIEQITHISLWAILAAPLLIGCDLTRLDEFTFNLLTNTEVIEVDQDPLGQMGKRVIKRGSIEVYKRLLWDGTYAVAVFNRSNTTRVFELKIPSLKLSGRINVRDLWLKQNLGEIQDKITLKLAPHGSKLLKLGTPIRDDFVL